MKSLVVFGLAVLSTLGFAEGAARVVEHRTETPQVMWYDEATQLKVEQMHRLGSASTVVAGTSMAWQGLVPDVLATVPEAAGSSGVYNAGLAGGVPVVMEPWLTGQVVDVLRPQLVVWGLSSLDFSDVYGDAGLAIYQQAPATRPGILADADRRLSDISALVRQRPALRNPSLLVGEERVEAIDRWERAKEILGPDGERLDFADAVNEDRALEVRTRISPYEPDREDVAAVVRTVEALRSGGVEVVLVELPVPPRFRALYDAGSQEHTRVTDLLRVLARELDVPLVSVTGTYDDADFVDFTHLDREGAARFSNEVAGALAALDR